MAELRYLDASGRAHDNWPPVFSMMDRATAAASRAAHPAAVHAAVRGPGAADDPARRAACQRLAAERADFAVRQPDGLSDAAIQLARPSIAARASRGFVLPVTVILLALISVGVSLMAHRSDQLRSLVSASRQEQQASVAVQNALAQALYLTSTLYRRGSRLGDIELDGRYYRS